MRQGWMVGVLVAVGLAGCLAPPDAPLTTAQAPPLLLDEMGFVDLGFAGVLHERVAIPSAVGGTIHAEVYRPDGSGPDRPVPVLITVSPYNAPGVHAHELRQRFGAPMALVEEYVPRGTAVAWVDARGFGGSSGCWDYYGDDEQADAVAAVEHFAARPWSNGKVGMFGTSYPGTTQLLAALGNARGLAAIAPIAPEPSVYENQFKNGVPYRSLQGTSSGAVYAGFYPAIQTGPPGAAVAAYPAFVEGRATSGPCLVESTTSLTDPDTRYSPYYAERDRQGDAGLVQVPVLWSHGFWDQNVKPDTAFPFWTDLAAPKRAWFWHGYHEDPTEDATGRDGFYALRHRWFDRWLHGAGNGVEREPPVEVQDNLGRWRHEAAWPPLDAAPARLYPASGGLAGAPGAEAAASIRTDPRTNFGAILSGGARSAAPVLVPEGAHRTAATPPLETPLHVAGIPQYQARLALDMARGQVVVGLFDVAPDHTWTLVDRGALDLRHRNGVDRVDDVVPGEVMDVRFDGWPTDWVFQAGHRVATVWVGTEMRYAPLTAAHALELHEGHGTFVELPVIGPRAAPFAETTSSAMVYRERMGPPEGFVPGR